MNILVFDTETINLNNPFCYNIGYAIYDLETRKKLVSKDFVIKQVWYNKTLFITAYYGDKRQEYIKNLRSKKSKLIHWGYAMRAMKKDIEKYNVEYAYAFNSPFDVKVLSYNCNWFGCKNALNETRVIDIRALINKLIFSKEYKSFCEEHSLFTTNNNYQINVESITKYIKNNKDFVESHMALSDVEDESNILFYMMDKYNVDITIEKKVYNVVKRE